MIGLAFGGRQCGYESKRFVAYWWFVGWDCISLGAHVCTSAPNVEIHLPFGFIRIGRPPPPVDAIWRIMVNDEDAVTETNEGTKC